MVYPMTRLYLLLILLAITSTNPFRRSLSSGTVYAFTSHPVLNIFTLYKNAHHQYSSQRNWKKEQQQQKQYTPFFESKQSLYETSSSSSSSSSSVIDTLIHESIESFEIHSITLRNQTLLRILLPSLVYALITFTIYPSLVHALTDAIRTSFDGLAEPHMYGPATLNLILTDNSNQFIQNIHNFCGLLFTLLTAHTFSFLIKQQETLYLALFEEFSTLQSLLEQLALVSEGRPYFYQTLLSCVQNYVQLDLIPTMNLMTATTSTTKTWQEDENMPAFIISTRPRDDPLETILYLTSVGEPSYIYSTLRSLRQARAKRLGSLQRKMPDIQMTLLSVFGLMVLCTFPVVATGAQTVGGEALIQVQRIHLSVGTFALGCVLGIVHELRRPGIGSAYNMDYTVLQNLLRGLHVELQTRLFKCRSDIKLGSAEIENLTHASVKANEEEKFDSSFERNNCLADKPMEMIDVGTFFDHKHRNKYQSFSKSLWSRMRSFRQKHLT